MMILMNSVRYFVVFVCKIKIVILKCFIVLDMFACMLLEKNRHAYMHIRIRYKFI